MKIYLRHEKTTDRLIVASGKNDVVAYKSTQDVKNRVPFARWPWHYQSIPKKNTKHVNLNCYRYDVVWLD